MGGLAAALALGLAPGAQAQAIDCNRLALQIASAGRDPSASRYAAAAQTQSSELARTIAHARALGCDRVQFLFFGSPKPPQCDGLNAQIARMQANLAQLQRAAAGGGLKRQLQAQYDEYCRQRRGILEQLFGDTPREYPPAEVQDEEPREALEDRGPRRGGPMAVCVRTCDGGFFPVSYSASRATLADLQDQCTALCPNTEAKIYTRTLGGDMKNAISAEGEAYPALANAFKFEKTFDAACTCKPPNKSWAEALAGAEQMIDARKGDIAVTPAIAEELSKPGARPRPAATKFDARAAQKLLEQKRIEEAAAQRRVIERGSGETPLPPALPEDELRDSETPGSIAPSRKARP